MQVVAAFRQWNVASDNRDVQIMYGSA